MAQTTFLITGAGSGTGAAAAYDLLEKGQNVRAAVHKNDERAQRLREAGAQVVVGDLLDFDFVRQAVGGMQRAYFCYPIQPGLVEATAQFAQAARDEGLEAVVNMSQVSARRDARSQSARAHWIAEQVFDWSGLAVTHLAPTYFAEWLLYLAPLIRHGHFPVPFGEGRHAPIAAEDQGRVIAEILANPQPHQGKRYPLYGPVELNHREIADHLTRKIGKAVRFEQVDIDTWGELTGKAALPYLIQHLGEVAVDHTNGVFAGGNTVVKDITGREPMSIDAFIDKHLAVLT